MQRNQPESPLFRTVAELIPDAACVVAWPSGKLVFANAQARAMVGHDLADLNAGGRHGWEAIIHLDDLERVADTWRSLPRAPKTQTPGVEFRAQRSDGAWFWSSSRLRVLERDDRGRPTHVLFVSRDTTDEHAARERLARSEEELQQAKRLEGVGRMAGGLAHDFNNALTVILGVAELLRLDRRSPRHVKASAGDIVCASERARALTRQLLTVATMQPVPRKTTNLAACVKRFEPMLRAVATDRRLQVDIDPDLQWVDADGPQFERVLLNLVVNAHDATSPGDVIALRLYPKTTTGKSDVPDGDWVVLEVSDHGTGMSSEVQSRLFEPFFTTKGAGKGTGLGLATVRELLLQWSGHIAITSKPGEGSSFFAYLPPSAPGKRHAQTPATTLSRVKARRHA